MDTHNKQLLQYSALASTILLSGSAIEDKVYYDIDPDLVFTSDTGYIYSDKIDLDVNNDNVADFRLRLNFTTTYTGWAAYALIYNGDLYPLGTNEVFIGGSNNLNICDARDYAGTFNYIGKLSDGATISPAPASGFFTNSNGREGIWDEGKNQVLFFKKENNYWYDSSCIGEPLKNVAGFWPGAVEQHVAILFHQDGNEYPGWIRLSVDAINQITVHDFAISLSAGGTISAGDTSDAIIAAPPVTLPVSSGATFARLKWMPIEGALSYIIRYRPVGSLTWIYRSSFNTKKKIVDLLCEGNYEWQVKALLHSAPVYYSFWSDVQIFSTLSCKLGANENGNNESVSFSITPNPAHDYVQIETDALYEGAVIQLLNLNGEILLTQKAVSEVSLFNVEELNAGIYLVRLINGDEEFTRKIAVIR